MSGALATEHIVIVDSITVWGETVSHSRDKGARTDTHLIGMVGFFAEQQKFLKWMADAENREYPRMEDTFAAIALARDGTLTTYGTSGPQGTVGEPFWVMGSTADIVSGAIWGGASLIPALMLAAKRCLSFRFPLYWQTWEASGVLTWDMARSGNLPPEMEEACRALDMPETRQRMEQFAAPVWGKNGAASYARR